ncbi:PLP-dependent transferase [Multifurca ochricompacta]|uniref:PLP-dependent transferase n=1 Tax=Multifurca ochricompacta TaxID=376703 RepID=A0AAD4M2L1_9AGAM|nr:PLP-dependent transferase [Multifurca ochricompacta]
MLNVTGSGANETSGGIGVLPPSYYEFFLSEVAKARKPSPIRGLLPLEQTPGLISLLAGKPNAVLFPFTSLQFTAPDPNGSNGEVIHKIDDDMLSTALQYGPTSGIPHMVEWLMDFQEQEHGRKKKGEGWRVSVTAGSQDGIYKAVQALLNPGDAVLIEKPVYAGVIPMFETLGCEMIEVETDPDGLNSLSLHHILENWPSSRPKPKLLYTVPYGCNPTGATTTLARRHEVLDLLRKHDILILEDDPYYFLYFGTRPRIPSYFMLEAQTGDRNVGRVLRFDSFSKILSAGIRVGFVTGPTPILDAMDRHTATANLQPSSFSQAVIITLLRAWGRQGFLAHAHKVSKFYREKRDVFEAAMRRHLHGLAEWNTPEAGMFRLLLGEDGDSANIIRTKAFKNGVLALPGTVFLPNGAPTAYVRAAFSLLEEEQVDEALRRLSVVLLEERRSSGGLSSRG